MNKIKLLDKRRVRRKRHIRKNIAGTAERPRISVFKSNKFIYAQAIDDDKGNTIVSASSLALLKGAKKKNSINIEVAQKVGDELGKKLKEKKISTAVFDRNGYLFTGRLKALADATRKAGIVF